MRVKIKPTFVRKPAVTKKIADQYEYDAHPWGCSQTRLVVNFGPYCWERCVLGQKTRDDCIALWANEKERRLFLPSKTSALPVPPFESLGGFIKPATTVA